MRQLTGATFQDRLRIAKILARREGRRLRRLLALPRRVSARFQTRAPDRLIIAPQDIRTADPTIAAEIAAGYFAFGGKIVSAVGRSPFALESAPVEHQDPKQQDFSWAFQLASFAWLRHLRTADTPQGRQRGRMLVDEFIAMHPRPSAVPAWEPAVTARRLLSWLSQSPVVLEGADRAFYSRFMQALDVNRAHLDRALAGEMRGSNRLLVALALAEYGLCAHVSPAQQRRGSAVLAEEIGAQVLADGGHVSRNPQSSIELLLDLLPLRQAYAARGIQAPQQVLNAIDRMMPMLRLFRHGDGTLALFNGMSLTAPELVATILAYDDARAAPIVNARYAGYQRVEAGATLMIVDTGAIPPRDFSHHAHAGCLAFELSSGIRRIVVNCGAPEGGRADVREAARTTAAHSTLVVDDTSSCRFVGGGPLRRWVGDQVLAGPTTVLAERNVSDGDTHLTLWHDGYVARFGLVHHRTLVLSGDGRSLDGTDRLAPAGKRKPVAAPYAIRFHLHPSIRARLAEDGASVLIDAPDGETWLFQSELPCVVEPSILFAASGGPRASTQIVVAAHKGDRDAVRWSFRQLAAAVGAANLLTSGPAP